MTRLTKKQQRERLIAEFVRRLREAPLGTRVYMRVGDVFKDADVHSLDKWRAARRAAVIGTMRGETSAGDQAPMAADPPSAGRDCAGRNSGNTRPDLLR
jgi:hypothetical protein